MPPDPDQLVLLTTRATEFEAQGVANALEATGIRAQVFSAAARMVQWEGGMGNQAKVFVRRADSDAALEVLRTLRQGARGIDWSSIDVGEMEPGETPPPARDASRVRGLSPLLWRIRIIGFTLMAMPILVSMAGPDRGLFAIAFCVLVALFADAGVSGRVAGQRMYDPHGAATVSARPIGPGHTPPRDDVLNDSPTGDSPSDPHAG